MSKKKTSKNVDEDQIIEQNAFVEDTEVESTERGRPSRRKVYERVKESEIPDYVREHFKKDNYDLRLVRWQIAGEPDYRYLTRREQEGYEFVKTDEVPKEYLRTMRIRDTQVTKGLVTAGGIVTGKPAICQRTRRKS